MDELLLEVDVTQVEADRLGAAQPGGVDELDERAVPEGDGPVPFERLEHLLHLGGARRIGETARPPRRERRVGHPSRAQGVAEEPAHGSELPPDRGRRELPGPASGAGGAEVGCVVDERAHVDVVQRGTAALEPRAELLDVVAVCAAGAVRERGGVEEARGGRAGVHEG